MRRSNLKLITAYYTGKTFRNIDETETVLKLVNRKSAIKALGYRPNIGDIFTVVFDASKDKNMVEHIKMIKPEGTLLEEIKEVQVTVSEINKRKNFTTLNLKDLDNNLIQLDLRNNELPKANIGDTLNLLRFNILGRGEILRLQSC